MDYYFDPYMMEELITAVVTALTSSIPSLAFGIATYVLSSLSLYTIANRRGISKPWLGWIPVLNVWILGSISDQYRYVAKGQVKSKRKVLLVLNILSCVLSVSIIIACIVAVVQLISGAMYAPSEDAILEMLMGPMIAVLGMTLPLMGIALASAIIHYIVLYDVYTSMEPANSVVFLVLSILFSFTEPIFLFVCRNKDGGMPPRKVTQVEENPPMSYGLPEEPQISHNPEDCIF